MNEEEIKEIAEEEAQSALAVAQNQAPEIEPEENISPEAGESPPEVAESQLEETPSQPEMERISEGRCASITPMSDWIDKGSDEECRPCLLAPVAIWYIQELGNNNLTELANEVKESIKTDGSLEISQKLDEIKGRVPDGLKERLREFDCAAQLYKEINGKKERE